MRFIDKLADIVLIIAGLLGGAIALQLIASCATAPAAAQTRSVQEADLCLGGGCGQPWCTQRGVKTPQLFLCGEGEDLALEFKKETALDTHWVVASPDDAGGDNDDDLTFGTDTLADVLVLGAAGVVTVGDVLAMVPRATAPGSPTDGMVYYDSTGSDAVCARINGSWVVLGGGGSCA